jgi:hypothetical protein
VAQDGRGGRTLNPPSVTQDIVARLDVEGTKARWRERRSGGWGIGRREPRAPDELGPFFTAMSTLVMNIAAEECRRRGTTTSRVGDLPDDVKFAAELALARLGKK